MSMQVIIYKLLVLPICTVTFKVIGNDHFVPLQDDTFKALLGSKVFFFGNPKRGVPVRGTVQLKNWWKNRNQSVFRVQKIRRVPGEKTKTFA